MNHFNIVKNANEDDKEMLYLQMALAVYHHAMPTVICLIRKKNS